MSVKIVDTVRHEEFPFMAALYFLDEQGQYLFKWRKGDGFASKFLRPDDVSAALSGREADSGWIEPGIKRFGSNQQGDWFIYHRPRQMVHASFVTESEVKVLHVPVPSTILVGHGKRCFIFAVKGVGFDLGAKLFQAPFPNVYPDGSICWGDSRPPEATHVNAAKVWELFFRTAFSAHLAEHKITITTGSCVPWWVSLAERQAKIFPSHWLIDIYRKLSSVL